MGIYDIMSIHAAKTGDVQTMQYLFITNKNHLDYLKIGNVAAKYGKLEIIKLLDKYFPLHGIQYISKAVKHNNIEVVKYIVEQTNFVNIYNKIGIYAAMYNNFLIMKWAVENGANDLDMFASVTAKYGYIELLKWLILKGANKFNMMNLFAAEGGNVDVVMFLFEKGSNNVNDVYYVAKDFKHEKLCEYLRKEKSVKDDEVDVTMVERILYPVKKLFSYVNFIPIGRKE